MKKKIFLTGQTGFIGGGIFRKLNSTDFIYKKKKYYLNYDYIDLNKNKLDCIKLFQEIECVIHCAGKAHIIDKTDASSFSTFKKINIESTRMLAEEAAKLGVKRFIFLSSIGVNGISTKKSEKFTYKDTPAPVENYAISKLRAEEALLDVSKKTGLEVVIIRLPLVYGERVTGNFLRLLNTINRGFFLPFGKIDNLKSFIGLDNLIDLIIYCIDHPKATGKILLASDGEDISTPDLIKKISNAMGKPKRLFPFPVSVIKLIGKIFKKSYEVERLLSSLRIDSSGTQNLLGWKPPFTLDEGLLNTVKWYLNKK